MNCLNSDLLRQQVIKTGESDAHNQHFDPTHEWYYEQTEFSALHGWLIDWVSEFVGKWVSEYSQVNESYHPLDFWGSCLMYKNRQPKTWDSYFRAT